MAIQKITNGILYGLAADTKPTTYANNTLLFVQDTGDVFRYNLGTTAWILLNGASKTETLTNKTIAAASNTVTGLVDANIGTHTTTKISTTSKSLLNTAIVYNDQINTYGNFDQTFLTSKLKILNPAATFNYIIATSAIITADKTVTLPLLTADDTFVTAAFAQTLTNKTINATNNTITDTSTAAGDILASNGTKFARLARGSANQVLQTNSGATDIGWASISAYTEAKGSSTQSGNASTTAFNIAHGLGSAPTFATAVQKATDANDLFAITVDATNIIVTYSFAPPTGTNNLIWFWRAAL